MLVTLHSEVQRLVESAACCAIEVDLKYEDDILDEDRYDRVAVCGSKV